MEEHRKKGSCLKVVGVLVLVAIMVGLFGLGWFSMMGSRRWGEVARLRETRLAETKARASTRSVLRGETLPGSAWEEYGAALAELGKDKIEKNFDSVLGGYVGRSKNADRAAAEALLARHLSALDHLKRGARCADGQFAYQWEKGPAAEVPGLLGAQRLANLAVCRSRLLADQAHPREAAELMLDLCQFAGDLGRNGVPVAEMIGIAVSDIAFQELRNLIQAGKLSIDDLAEIDSELAILDRGFPRTGESLLNGRLLLAYGLDKDSRESTFWEHFEGWRYGFSFRLEAAEAILQYDEWMQRYAQCDLMAWTEVEKISDGIDAQVRRTHNRFLKAAFDSQTPAARLARERRTQLSLLRVAAHYRTKAEILNLDDPFGKKIQAFVEGGKLRIWGVGRDGVDNHGAGGWNPTNEPNTDIVFELDE